MKLYNARRAIHDAFALHVTTPESTGVVSGTKYDSDADMYRRLKGGLIVRAVMDQKTYLTGCALFMNAHEGVVNHSELYSLKRKLWIEFLRNSDLADHEQAEVMCAADHLLLGHRCRVWDHATSRLTLHSIVGNVATAQKAVKRMTRNCTIYLDQLTKIDNESLSPVWAVINDQREKRNEKANAPST